MNNAAKIAEIEAKLAAVRQKRNKVEQEKEKLDRKVRKYENENKLLYFNHPGKGYLGKYGKWEQNPPQKQLFQGFRNPRHTVLVYSGGNRGGKTFSLVAIAFACLFGYYPWEDPKEVGHWVWDSRGWEPPIKLRIVGQDWEKHVKTVLVPRIKELLPNSWKVEVRKNNVGVEAYYTFPTGTIEILSNKSEPDLFEGWEGHGVFYDEPSRREVRIACARGLADYNGIEMFSMTLLKEAWVDLEVIQKTLEDGSPDPSIYQVHAEIFDNIGFGIDKKGVDNFASKLSDEEKDVRLRGIPSYKQGLVLKIDRNTHFIERFDIPANWIIVAAVDIGVAKPHDILYIAISPKGFWYFCFEEQVKGNGFSIADSIIKKKQRYNMRLDLVIIDPLAKASQESENSTYAQLETGLMQYDIFLKTGEKHKEDGIIQLNSRLHDTVNKTPSCFVFRDMPITTRQLSNWMYDDTGKPSKKDDDMCENGYRFALLDIEWYPHEPQDYEYVTTESSHKADQMTGY